MEKTDIQNTKELLTALHNKSEIIVIDEQTSSAINKGMRLRMHKLDIAKKKKAVQAKRSLGSYLVNK